MSDITIYTPPTTVADNSPEDFNRNVREIFKRLYNSGDPDFQGKATSQKDTAVEGSVNADKYAVADAIRTYAVESGEFPDVASANLERINRAAGYAARHFGVGRNQIALARQEWEQRKLQQQNPQPQPFHRDGDSLAG